MNILRKNKDLFPPYMVDGIDLLSVSRRMYLQYSESFNALIISIIFINYIFFCSEEGNVIFQMMTIIISTIIFLDFLVKVTLIRPLYFNRYYYGEEFILLDILSGPVSLILIIAMQNNDQTIRVSSLLVLLKIFTLERISFVLFFRLLIKDVTHILYVTRFINLGLFLSFYVYSSYAYGLFQVWSPKFFGNIFISMLSMFQVLTLDSWNAGVNQSVSRDNGQVWSLFFIFFIIFMFFYFINLLLGAFVSYYSNPNLRINYEYDYDHDDKLNPDLFEEYRQTIQISKALQILDLQHDQFEKINYSQWGLGQHQVFIYAYTLIQIGLAVLVLQVPSSSMTLTQEIFEQTFGIYFCLLFAQQLWHFKRYFNSSYNVMEEEGIRHEEKNVRLYTLTMLFIAGPIASLADLFTSGNLQYGPCARVTVLLAVQCLQKAIFKFVEVLPGVSHIILFVGGIIFTMSLLGHEFLKELDPLLGAPTFATMTTTYLFLLQVITFDDWGDVARVVINQKGGFFVLYFLFLTIFVGFFLLNMLVGIMATMTQPKTQELFEKEHILSQRVNKPAVFRLKEQIEIHRKNQNLQNDDEITLLKEMLEEFNNSNDPDEKLYVYLGGQQYEITSKNFLLFDDDQ